MFMGVSFPGLFNLPHYKYRIDHFKILVQFFTNFYPVGVDSKSAFKTIQQYLAYTKANPGKLSMGSNKIASLHHRVQTALFARAGVDVRFMPYKGTGKVVKDVIGGHLSSGIAQPGLWLPQMKAGKARVLLVLDNGRLDHPSFKDILTPKDIGLDFKFLFSSTLSWRENVSLLIVKKMNEGFLKDMVETRKFIVRHRILKK
jgi:tripartite-type tricarboxylate transporter receptor subunit TctC